MVEAVRRASREGAEDTRAIFLPGVESIGPFLCFWGDLGIIANRKDR
jgi:hypothetical protein